MTRFPLLSLSLFLFSGLVGCYDSINDGGDDNIMVTPTTVIPDPTPAPVAAPIPTESSVTLPELLAEMKEAGFDESKPYGGGTYSASHGRSFYCLTNIKDPTVDVEYDGMRIHDLYAIGSPGRKLWATRMAELAEAYNGCEYAEGVSRNYPYTAWTLYTEVGDTVNSKAVALEIANNYVEFNNHPPDSSDFVGMPEKHMTQTWLEAAFEWYSRAGMSDTATCDLIQKDYDRVFAKEPIQIKTYGQGAVRVYERCGNPKAAARVRALIDSKWYIE